MNLPAVTLKGYVYGDLTDQEVRTLTAERYTRTLAQGALRDKVLEIVLDVRAHGDEALRRYATLYDGGSPLSLIIEKSALADIAKPLPDAQKKAIEVARKNIHAFHKAQSAWGSLPEKVETSEGVVCWSETRAIDKVGLYIPGGSAVLPSTLLMLGIPAILAGVPEIVVCSPPRQEESALLHPAIAFTAQLLGIEKICLAGGAQAVAAMAFGTDSIPAVHKIFGPGNSYVTLAKQWVQQLAPVSIDMPAGPSELLVIADDSADPAFVAADLLSQAEHGPDSQVVLVSSSQPLIDAVIQHLSAQINRLPRAATAFASLQHAYFIKTDHVEASFRFSNQYAPEHLIVTVENALEHTPLIKNAGSVFFGNYAPESAGDYASGTNHTLPTSGFATSYSGVSTASFQKKISFQHITAKGLIGLGPTIETLAYMEGLHAHAIAVEKRLDKLQPHHEH